MKISALWITKNEEENIEKSIRSVAEVADELIVADTGSTDGTARIAEELGAAVYGFEWVNDFSAARNFALDQASGEVILFLDADEWFEPALTKADRDEIAALLSQGNADGVSCALQSLDSFGGVRSAMTMTRVFHTRNNPRYENKIHERLARPDGRPLNLLVSDKWVIKHSGYAEDKQAAKQGRNLALLESLKESGAELSTLDKFYLMRESYNTGKTEDAFAYFRELSRTKKKIAQFIAEYPDIAPSYFYIALDIASNFRDKVSREEIHANIVNHMKKLLPDYPGTASADLYYALLFAFDERKFLAALAEYEQTKKDPAGGFDRDLFYKPVLQRLYSVGAEAKLARGEKEAAMGYALKAMTCHTDRAARDEVIKVFTRAVRGADETSTVLLLSKIQALMGGTVSEGFLDSLMYENLKSAYLYFFKKQYDAGAATKARFLYLKILNGSPKEAAETALANRREMRAEDLSQLIFHAVVRADEYAFYLENKEHLGKYADVAEAYFENRALENPNMDDAMIYSTEYRSIVFAAGRDIGERFLSVFAANPSFRFMIKCGYYMDGGLYGEFLAEEEYGGVYTLHPKARIKFARCCVFAAQYERALSIFKILFAEGQLSYEIVNGIGAVAEQARGSVKEEAERLYGEYSAVLEEMTDFKDKKETGVAFDKVTRKEARALAALTPRDFKKEMFNTPVIASERLLDIYMAVAELYMEKKMYGMAERYLRQLLVSGYRKSEVSARLAEAYEKLGNAALAAELAKLADAP